MHETPHTPITTTFEIPSGIDVKQSSTEAIGHLQQLVRQFAEDNDINPGDVLYRGYNIDKPLEEGADNWEGFGQPTAFFGTFDSMDPPQHITEDIEAQGEHWQVNPLYHALRSGTLGLYDRAQLGQALDEEFGTFVFNVDQVQVDASEIATIRFSFTTQKAEEATKSPETIEEAGAKELFKPLFDASTERTDEGEVDLQIAKWLVGYAVVNAAKPTPEQKKLIDDKWRAKVTEESLQKAEPNYRMIKQDPQIQGAVDEYVARTGSYLDRDVMAGLRFDPVLRLVVGMRLLGLVDSHPYSIRMGITEKTTNVPGYIKMTSNEYVASLIMAMADGTFKSNESDEIQTDSVGLVTHGLHRSAARGILRSGFHQPR
jgi:hypothetical protein